MKNAHSLLPGRLWQVDLPDQQVSRTEGEEQTFCFTCVFLDGDEIFRWDQFEMNLRWLFFRLLVIIDGFEMRPSQNDTNVSLPKNSPKSFGWVPGGEHRYQFHRWRNNPAGASWLVFLSHDLQGFVHPRWCRTSSTENRSWFMIIFRCDTSGLMRSVSSHKRFAWHFPCEALCNRFKNHG